MAGDSVGAPASRSRAASRVAPTRDRAGPGAGHTAQPGLALATSRQELLVVVGEGVVAVGARQHVPVPGPSAGLSAASMLARPGAAIGVGGSPVWMRVL